MYEKISFTIPKKRRRINAGRRFLGADSNNELHEAFNKMTGELNLATSGYSISACRDIINEDFEGYTVNNRKVKQMLIAHFGEEICFIYPRDKSKPQMFYSTNICPANLVETIRQTNPIKICAEKLRKSVSNSIFCLIIVTVMLKI